MPKLFQCLLFASAIVLGGAFLHKKRLLLSFLLNGVAGLLCCVLGVILSPLISLDFAFNYFTASVSFCFGPLGTAGLLLTALLWL